MGKLDTKKMIAALVMNHLYCKNIIFTENSQLNRDNNFNPYLKLKDIFFKYGYDLSTYDINTITNSKIVIYNDMPKILPKKKDIEKSYLLLFESELIRPDNWDREKHKYFQKIFTWDDRIVDNKKYFKINFTHSFPKSINKDLSKKEKLCTLIAGNKCIEHPLELYSKRVEAIRWFEKNYAEEFDFYGVGWDTYAHKNKYIRFFLRKTRLNRLFRPNFSSYKGAVFSKKETLAKYKFIICYENARDISGYITEKIFDCFFAGSIPIYWGADNIRQHIPKNCFIDKRNYDSYGALYKYIKEMKDEEYLEYLNNIEFFLNSNKSNQFKSEAFAKTIANNTIGNIK